MYQAIASACRRVRPLGQRAAIAALLLGCAETTPAAGRPDPSTPATAPLAHVTFASRRNHSLDLDDRLPLFDRIGFSSPSAILHDAARDVYWVSNLNVDGPPGSGFISRLDPEGKRVTLNFIDGRSADVKLNSPHGLAISGDSLLVADVTAIRKFNANTGAPEGSIQIPDTRYLSDVAVAADGSLFVADVGGDPNLASVPEEGTDAVYQISTTGQVSTVARRPDLGGPFALLSDARGVWIACTGSSELLLLVPSPGGADSPDGGRLELPGGVPRGLTSIPDGTLVISSWKQRAVYRGYRDGPFEPVITGLESPADLDYDVRRKRLLIPLLSGQALAIFELAPFEAGSSPP
ncbi:MAG TPA: hypothetical protein VJU61_19460 [Polyangiaceae bacterium]|nr:hypothetical protein [Polyangiaceae bacterium]